MEVKIGVRNVAREITLESAQTAEEVTAAVDQAIEKGTTLRLSDEKGRVVVVPAGVLGSVEIGAPEGRRVGFGTI